MARLRYNGLTGTLGAALTTSATSVTFGAALTHANGIAVPTIGGTDYIPLTLLDVNGNFSELVYLTAYTTGATTGTITRAAEGAGAATTHSSGDKFVHGPAAADFTATSVPVVPTVRASTNGWSASGGTFNVTVPATAQIGDLLVLSIGVHNNVSSAPSGWTLLGYTTGSYMNTTLLTKQVTAADPGSTVTVSIAGGTEAADWYCVAVAGASGVNDYTSIQATTGVASLTANLAHERSSDLVLVHLTARGITGTLTASSSVGRSLTSVANRADADPSALWSATGAGPETVTLTASPTPGGIGATAISIAPTPVQAPSPTIGGLLGSTVYNPATTTNNTITGTTDGTLVQDFDATNLAVSFTAPASGKVLVRLSGVWSVNTATTYPHWGLREGTTTLATKWLGLASVSSDAKHASVVFSITGLTPGSTHTYKWAGGIDNAAQLTLQSGGPLGQTGSGSSTMEVTDGGTYNPLLTPIGGTTTLGGLLGSTVYNPATMVTYTVSSTTVADLDATNLAVTFTAPTSGKVLVRLQTFANANAGVLYWALREGATTIAQSQVINGGGSNEYLQGIATAVITGLTPGSTHTYKWAAASNGITTHVAAGGTGDGNNAGAAIMEVLDGTTYTPVSGPTATFGEAAWTTPTLLNSWVNYGSTFATAAYRKDGSGVVYLRGVIKNGTLGNGIPVLNLPVGYRPSADLGFIVACANSGSTTMTSGLLNARANGDITIDGTIAGNGWLYLDGIRFYADASNTSTALIVDGGTP